VSEVPL